MSCEPARRRAARTSRAIDRGVCGNGLLESRRRLRLERSRRCVRCAVTCSDGDATARRPTTRAASTGCATRPAAGSRIRAPPARFKRPSSTSPMSITMASATRSDCRAPRSSCATARRPASSARVDSIITPTQTGPAALGDLDDDGSLDLTLTTADGLVVVRIAVRRARADRGQRCARRQGERRRRSTFARSSMSRRS